MSENQNPLIIDIPGPRPSDEEELRIDNSDLLLPVDDEAFRTPANQDNMLGETPEETTGEIPDQIDMSDDLLNPGDLGRQVGSAIKASRDLDGDTAAEILGLHKKTGLPKDAIEQNLTKIRLHESDRELDGLAQTAADEHPVTSEFLMKDRYHASVAREDVGVLGTIEQIFDAAFSKEAAKSAYRQGIVEQVVGAYNTIIRSPVEIAEQREKERAELEAAAARPDASLDTKIASVLANLGSLIPDPVESLVQGSVALTEQIRGAFGEEARDVREAVRVQSKAADEYLKSLAPESKSGEINYYVTEIVGGAAGMVPTILLGIYGGTRTALSEVGVRVFGLSYNEGRNKGLTPQQAAIRAAHLGAFEVLTERLPLEEILKPVSRLDQGTVRGLTERAKNILKAGGFESVQEGLATTFQILYDTMALDEDFDAAKAFREITDAMIIGGGSGGLSATGTNIAGAVMDRQRAKQVQERTAEILDRSRESILRERSPDAFDEFFQTLADDYERENINVSAAPVMDFLMQQGEDPVQFFGELGISEETVRDAYENGDDIKIKAGKFFSLMPDNEFRDQILLNLRENANTPTLAEAEIRTEQMAQRMEQVLADLDSEEEASVRQSAERIRNRFTQDAIAAGRSRTEAPRDAAVWEAMFVTAIDAYRNDPNRTADSRPLSEIAQELEEQVFNVRVRSVPFAERGQPLEQTVDTTSTNFRQFFEGSQVVDERGEPLVVYHATATSTEFDQFGDFYDSLGSHFGSASAANDRLRETTGIEFGDEVADTDFAEGDRPRVLPVYLSLKNPLRMSDMADIYEDVDTGEVFRGQELGETPEASALFAFNQEGRLANRKWENPIDVARTLIEDGVVEAEAFGNLEEVSFDDIKSALRERDYDGIVYQNTVEGQGEDSFIAFDPTQIKSQFNRGTFDPANANILHQTVTDATGKPLAVVHNISEAKLRHAAKMGGLPVPSLAIVDANQEFTNFGNIQLVADPSMVDPRASRRNRVFDADVYSPRYPSGDIERTIDDDAADAAQAELDAIGEEIGEGAYRPGWLRGELSDSGVKFLARERPIQVAFLRSIGVEQRIEATADAIEGREGEFNQFIEDTYGSLITQERILDQITDTGRRYLPHNLDNVVRIMKRELRGGERFSYGVGSIRAQVAKQFKSLKEIKDARESIVTEADMQAFKDDTDDAFGELAAALQPFYSGDRNQFGFLDVVVDMLSDFARRGEAAADDYGFENVSDDAKQRIVNFLANLRQAPTEYFEAKIQRAVGLDEFQGAIVPPETPQDIRNLLEENGLRVIEATDRSEALQQAFSQELFQSTVPLQSRPMKLEGTGPHGRVTNWDFATALNDRHLAKYGRALDPNDDDDFKIIVRELNREYRNQQRQDDTGNGWYVEDIEAAVDVTRAIIPELGQPINRDAFLIMAALLSPQQKPPANWDNAIYAMQGFIKTGRIALKKPNGKNFGVNSHRTGLQLFQHLIDERGLAAAIEWLQTPHTGKEIAEVRKASGLFKPKKQALTNFTASETNLTDTYLGIYMMGPKVGDFMLNATGFDPSAVTVDLWLARTYNRMIGRLLDVSPQKVEAKEIASEVRGVAERNNIKRVVRELAKLNGISPSAMQAALWYYEQRLYRNHGINSESTNFQGAAINAAQKRKIPVAGRGGGVQGVGQAEAGDVQTDLFQTVDPPPTGIGRLYSQAKRATQSFQQKATASQWLSHFKKNGVKDDELNWVVGLEEFLNSQKTIDKDDLLEFIEQNGIKLDEVQLGGPEMADGEPIFIVRARESLEEAEQEMVDARDALSNALESIGFTQQGVQSTLEAITREGSSIVQGAIEEDVPGIMDLAAFYQQASINRRIAAETLEIEETEGRDDDFVKFKRYTLQGPLEAPNQEFYLTLPADLTKGNADVEDWVVPEFHKIGDEVADNRLVIRIRANGRVLEDGRRVLFIEEMQDDRGQEASKQGVRERVSNLSARQQAYREAEIDAKTVMAKYFTGVEDIPTSERFSYLENVMKLAAGYEQYGERWVTSLNFRDFDFTPEEIEVVDRFIELNATEPDEVKLGDSYSMFRDGIPDRPFLQLNKVVPLALKRMMVEATERGYDAIAWTPGEIQTERYNMSRVITEVDVVEVNDEEAMIIAKQGSFGPVALEGVQTETMSFEPEYDLYQDEETGEWTISSDGGVLLEYGFPTLEDAEDALNNIRQQDELTDGPILNIVPRAKLAEFFGKEFADKIIEGGQGQTYDNLELDVGGTNHKKFYNKIVVNTANNLGKKFKARTGVGKVVVQEAQPDRGGEFTVGSEYYVRRFDDGFQVRQRDHVGDFASLSRMFETREEAEQELAAGAAERAQDPEVPAERYFVFYPDGRTLESFFDEASANNYARIYNEAQTGELPAVTEDVWVLPLTDELKDTILGEGLPMMQDPDDPLGSFDPVRRVINLFEQANYSTLLHESGHAFVNIMEELSKRDDAPARITENYQAMLEWTGATNAADLDIRINGEAAREKQERLARAFEAYLREGKAPSAKLQSAFSQFKEWLKKIYQNLTQLNVTMDDEIRTVFDRMLATDAEIADMAAAREFTMEDSPSILAMMDAEEREKAQRLQLAARDRAREARALDEARYAALLASGKYEEELEGVREEVTDKLFMERAYGAFYFLTRGELFGDRSTPEILAGKRIARSAMLEAGFTPEELKALPRMYGKSGKAVYSSNEADAADPEFLAAFLGYESGVELMAALRTIVNPDDEINRRAEEIMKSRPDYQDPANDGTLSQITEDALYNAEQAELIEMELDALARTAGMQRESRLFLQAVADRMFAEELVGDMLSPVKFAAASRRAARAAEQAANRGDAQKAFVEKRKELLNFELHRRAIKARKEVTSINNKLRRLQRRKLNPKTYDTSYHGHIKTLLAFYEFGTSRRTTPIDPEKMTAILDFINAMNEFDASLVMPAELLEFVEERKGRPVFAFKTKHWTEMTLPELRGIRDMADNFMKVAKDESAENEALMNERADLLAQGIQENTTKKSTPFDTTSFPTAEDEKKSLKERAINFYYEHRKLESLVRQLDGFIPNGPMQQAIYDGIARGRDYKHLMLEKLVNDVEKAFSHYTRKERKYFGSKKSAVIIGSLRNNDHPNGQAMTREHRVAIALNWGNESSREAVLDDKVRLSQFGAAWNEDAINEVLATLTEADLNFVEDVWRMIDQFWNDIEVTYRGETIKIPGIASLEKEFTGFAPPKVQPIPFEVNGRVLAGGYFPLRYDSRLSPRVDTEHQDTEIMKLTNSLGFARATTAHGFTNARIGSGGRPVRFGVDTIFSHLEDVVHDLAFRKPITEADTMIRKDAVKEAIYGTIGNEGYQTIRNLIVAIAQSNKPQDLSGFDPVVRTLRINSTVALMGLNLRVLLTQPAGLFQTKVEIGSRRTLEGYLRFMKHPEETTRLVYAKSVFLRERTKNITRELDEFSRTLRVRGASDTMKEMSLRPIGWVDAFTVAIPAWLGAYHKALDGEVENVPANDEKEAAKYADRVVERSQGAGDPTALAMLQQKDEWWKAASMFGSYFNTTMNLQSEAIEKRKLDIEKGEGQFSASSNLLSTTIMLQAVPAIVVGLMLSNWPSEDELEEDGPVAAWLKWTTLMVVNQAAGSIFLLRDFVQSITSGFDLSFTPIEGTLASLKRAGQSLYRDFGNMFEDGEFSWEYFTEKTGKSVAQAVSLFYGLPLMGAIRSGEAALHMADDELKNEPRNIVEAGQKLLLTGDR